MANYSHAAFVALFLALLPMAVFGDFDICSEVTCGKGKCQEKPGYIPHGYVCDCDSGWKRTRGSESEDQYLQFLPCVIPNCSVDYSCMPADPPLPALPNNPNDVSAFDPCYWIYCGEGTCSKSSEHMHTCECHSGARNLLNVSHFPCYSDCALGTDCSKLGINVSKSSVTTGPGSSSTVSTISGSSNHATSATEPWKLIWKASVMMISAVISCQ